MVMRPAVGDQSVSDHRSSAHNNTGKTYQQNCHAQVARLQRMFTCSSVVLAVLFFELLDALDLRFFPWLPPPPPPPLPPPPPPPPPPPLPLPPFDMGS